MGKNLSPRKKIAVIGAGPGGLASAMLLAHRGFEVTVFEKKALAGGRNSELKLGPYSFDIGPTFLMMKFLLDELFTETGRKSSSYLDFIRLDPMYRLKFEKLNFLMKGEREALKKEVEEKFPGEGPGLDLFHKREAVRFERMYPCLQKPYSGLQSYLDMNLIKAAPQLDVTRSLYQVLTDYFKAEELRLAFTFQSKYLGMSPWDCPGMFTMIPYVEHAYGIYHVMGGLHRINQAFAKVFQEEGGALRLGCAVKQIEIENGAAKGLLLEDGTRFAADEIVINADFAHAASHLFPEGALKKYSTPRLRTKKFSCSTFMLYLGLDKVYDLEHHTIIFANDYKQNLMDIAHNKVLSKDISLYVRNASINDPSLAPKGHSAIYVLVPVPNNQSAIDWEKEKLAFRELVLNLMEARGPMPGLRAAIREEHMITPLDWEQDHSVFLGATFNLAHNLSQMMHFRPHNQFEEVENCYLVGGGTHPGSGLPTIYESARISANLISKKYGVPFAKPNNFHEIQIESY